MKALKSPRRCHRAGDNALQDYCDDVAICSFITGAQEIGSMLCVAADSNRLGCILYEFDNCDYRFIAVSL
jgi:hypothetical protein